MGHMVDVLQLLRWGISRRAARASLKTLAVQVRKEDERWQRDQRQAAYSLRTSHGLPSANTCPNWTVTAVTHSLTSRWVMSQPYSTHWKWPGWGAGPVRRAGLTSSTPTSARKRKASGFLDWEREPGWR